MENETIQMLTIAVRQMYSDAARKLENQGTWWEIVDMADQKIARFQFLTPLKLTRNCRGAFV